LHSHPEGRIIIECVLKEDDDTGAQERGNDKLMEKVTYRRASKIVFN
jgi:hypothetical protein